MAPKKKKSAAKASAQPDAPVVPLHELQKERGDQPSTDELQRKKGSLAFAVVGIVASAGGLDAYKRFFSSMPKIDCALAFVVVPHLDPGHNSLMTELIGKFTAMSVVEATNGMPLAPHHVYVIPPNKYITIAQGLIRLSGPVERDGAAASLDIFLRSLAEECREMAIGIILSGTGAYGTLGLRAIKAAGGVGIVQDPRSAEFDSMPRSAIATGLADYVLRPEEMPEALVRYCKQAFSSNVSEGLAAQKDADLVGDVLAFIRGRSKFDFRGYRKAMAARRIQRRMHLNQIDDVQRYLAFLHENPRELPLLIKDLLISVTSFFRDPEAFQLLQVHVASLVQAKEPQAPLRVWVPGCATGEEAYSIAILLLEQLTAAQKRCPVQVFATDLDEDALNVARQGIYPESIIADVSPARLERFFTRTDQHSFHVGKELRQCVIFAAQNLVGDAAFSKLDLVSCRNLLIYLEPEVQKRVLGLFHFALTAGGVLMLGSPESISLAEGLFTPISKKWRLFRRLRAQKAYRPDFRLPFKKEGGHDGERVMGSADVTPSFAQLTQRVLLDDFVPAAVLVNSKYEILYLQGPVSRFLNLPSGAPTLQILDMAPDGLRAKIRSTLFKASQARKTVVGARVRVEHLQTSLYVKVTVKPIPATKLTEETFLVVLEETLAPSRSPALSSDHSVDDSQVRELEAELKIVREELQEKVEQIESTNEEVKASNEEMMSMNEELQSTNEELETSKEELQSLNEELTTVNAQLQEKIQALEGTTNDLANLLNSTDLAALFLDRGGRIKRFTPSSRKLFNLIEADLGRPIRDITHNFADADLLRDIQKVLEDHTPLEKEVAGAGDRWYTRRILPYRTRDNRVDGVVLTFADVSELKRVEFALRQDKDLHWLASVLMDSNDALTIHDLRGNFLGWNRAAERVHGISAQEALKVNLIDLFPEDERIKALGLLDWVEQCELAEPLEIRRQRKDGAVLDVSLGATLLLDPSGQPHAIATTERDVTKHKIMERAILTIAALEQRKIGQELHDSTGQELTGLALVAESLSDTLSASKSPDADLANKVAVGIKRALSQVRAFSRGLIPVEVDGLGLSAALQKLVTRIADLNQITCVFEQDEPVFLRDHLAATHLYRIAQEAIANALKHGYPKKIIVRLGLENGHVTLRVQDDGAGVPAEAIHGSGVGMGIMRYRAEVIRASLKVETAPGGGTLIICSLTQALKPPTGKGPAARWP